MRFRQAFLALGIVNDNKPLKQLNDEEEFSALANWVIHKLPLLQSMILRINADGAIYQTVVRRCQGHLRVGKIVILEERPQLEEEQADVQDEERSQSEEEQADDISWDIPRIALRETERNCWEVVLTEEERELINEFLEI